MVEPGEVVDVAGAFCGDDVEYPDTDAIALGVVDQWRPHDERPDHTPSTLTAAASQAVWNPRSVRHSTNRGATTRCRSARRPPLVLRPLWSEQEVWWWAPGGSWGLVGVDPGWWGEHG
jgi:hypothetical protein